MEIRNFWNLETFSRSGVLRWSQRFSVDKFKKCLINFHSHTWSRVNINECCADCELSNERQVVIQSLTSLIAVRNHQHRITNLFTINQHIYRCSFLFAVNQWRTTSFVWSCSVWFFPFCSAHVSIQRRWTSSSFCGQKVDFYRNRLAALDLEPQFAVVHSFSRFHRQSNSCFYWWLIEVMIFLIRTFLLTLLHGSSNSNE